MKPRSLTFALAVAIVVPCAVAAADEPKAGKEAKPSMADKPHKAQSQTPPQQGSTNVSLTGSYIEQNIRRTGRITDGANPVIVIDHKEIERSGAQDLKQLLRRQGIGR